MTFKEKLQKIAPEFVGNRYRGGCYMCPVTYGFEEKYPHDCEDCEECWNREMEENGGSSN